MKFGFIGAGKVGFSLGKYLADNNQNVVGYYSIINEEAIEAAKLPVLSIMRTWNSW